ncbi:T3SS effector HopA1 family protein [Streptomyces sp. CNZ287]|uniref:T3SS effector HopA1 family protein n=1 Tax=Streptomyces sp. B22F1 TaxID=3153566 RepID=UPI00119A06C1
MTHADNPLPGGIKDALCRVTVRRGGRSALAWGEELVAEGPIHLRTLLQLAVYERLHAGLALGPETWMSGARRDAAVESRLLAAMPHRDTVVRARPAEWRAGELLADIGGVRVRVPAERVRGEADEGRVSVALPAARPALSPGYFLADGSRGGPRGTPLLRVYVHLDAAEAVPAVWSAVLRCLEDREVPYRAKVSSSSAFLPRRDGLVVYLGPADWSAAVDVASSSAGLPGQGADVSAFAAQLAPGAAVAWEPPAAEGAGRRLSFGEHRAMAVATGLMEHALGGGEAPKADAVAAALRGAGIDPRAPYRNLDSPPLDFLAVDTPPAH